MKTIKQKNRNTDPNSLVVYNTFNDAFSANVVLGLLQSSGIVCFLADENITGVNPLYCQAVGGIKLQVRAKDVEKVTAILQAKHQEPVEPTEPANENLSAAVSCPQCHSANVYYGSATKKKYNLFTGAAFMLVSLLVMAYPPFRQRKVYHCFGCGEEFEK